MRRRRRWSSSEQLARYGFGDGHPFGPDRHAAFLREFRARGLDRRARVLEPREATDEELLLFHTPAYVDLVRERSRTGSGYLDGGDTPAFRGVYEAAALVVGATLNAAEAIMSGQCAPRLRADRRPASCGARSRRGFCVFNDCGVAIELLRKRTGLERIAYVDIDAHHGDGVFYAFEDDPRRDLRGLHEDGRYLYPGTGARDETGKGAAAGTKLNIPLPPGRGRRGVRRGVAAGDRASRALRAASSSCCSAAPTASRAIRSPTCVTRRQSHGRAARDLAQLADRLRPRAGAGAGRRRLQPRQPRAGLECGGRRGAAR